MKRVKRRYLAVQLESVDMPSERDFMDAVWAAITKLYGEVGASATALTFISFDGERRVFVVRCLLASLSCVRASLATVTSVAGKDTAVHVLAVSGTLKALFASF